MSDTFRTEYRELTAEERRDVTEIKDQASRLLARIQRVMESRERSLAITKLEEAVMWAVKGITR